MEASSHGSALHRLDRVRFDALVFTNLSQDHLDLHGTMEEYFQAKRRLFTGAAAAAGGGQRRRRARPAAGGRARRRASCAAGHLRLRPTTPRSGRRARADAAAAAVSGRPGSTSRRRCAGGFNVENVLGAVAAGLLLDLDDDAIATGIARVTGVPGRFEAIDEGQPFAVVVDYAHTPDSLDDRAAGGARARRRAA